MTLRSFVAAALLALATSACGTGKPIETKEEAATAMQRIGVANYTAQDASGFMNGLSVSISREVDGKDGEATVGVVAQWDPNSLAIGYEIEFDDYSADGFNYVDGDISLTLSLYSDLVTQFDLNLRLRGELDIDGEYDEDIEFDMGIDLETFADAMRMDGSLVKLVLDGRVETDDHRWEFPAETIEVTSYHAD